MKPSIDYLTNIPIIDLGDIILRPIQYEDYLDMYEYGSDDEVTKTVLWNSYKDIAEAQNAIQNVFLSRPNKGVPSAYSVVFKKNNKMIGTCDIFKVDWESMVGEIGYALNRNYWGKGYMTLACNALIDFGFNYLKLKKIEIGHMVGNHGSRRVIEKCGFDLYKRSNITQEILLESSMK